MKNEIIASFQDSVRAVTINLAINCKSILTDLMISPHNQPYNVNNIQHITNSQFGARCRLSYADVNITRPANAMMNLPAKSMGYATWRRQISVTSSVILNYQVPTHPYSVLLLRGQYIIAYLGEHKAEVVGPERPAAGRPEMEGPVDILLCPQADTRAGRLLGVLQYILLGFLFPFSPQPSTAQG